MRCQGRHFEWQKALTNVQIMIYSKYYEELDTVAQKRYREKLNIAGVSCAPYCSNSFFTRT